MSDFIISDYTGKFLHQFNDEFIRKRPNRDGHIEAIYVERITHLAESLFCLSDEPTFSIAIRRLLDRDVRPVFFELSAASFFKRRGFSVVINQEIGVKGRDFDFIAKAADGTLINVEVSEFLSQNFSQSSLKNKLETSENRVFAVIEVRGWF